MPHPFTAGPVPLVFAHRGGAALAPENTLPALDRGLACGVDGLEIDVHLSRDGVVVVHHDETLDRTTDRRGPVGAFTADELAGVDAGFRFALDGGHPFRGQGIGVPTLRSVLARYENARFIIEMKVDSIELAGAVVAEIRRADAVDRVCVGAFAHRALHAVRGLEPALATSASGREVRLALYRSWWRWPVGHAPYVAFQVPEKRAATRVVSPRFIRAAHAGGRPVHVWTINAVDDAERLLEWGVDALITDRPDLIVPVVRRTDAAPVAAV